MTSCPTCGFDKGELVTRGPLRVTSDPPEAYWHGKRMILPPVQAKMLGLLAARGSASNFALSLMCPTDAASYDTVQVHICKLRACLPREIRITTVRGWGYTFVMEEDMTKSTHTAATIKPKTLKALTLDAANAIRADDLAAITIVLPAKGGVRVTPMHGGPADWFRMLGEAVATLGFVKEQHKPVEAAPTAPIDEPADTRP